MKSKISLFNKAIFKRSVRGSIGLWIGILAVYMMVIPISIYFQLASWVRTANGEALHKDLADIMIQDIWNMGGFVVLFAAVAVITAVVVFSYLFTARNTNMMHTFPVTRGSLFCTNYMAGLLYQVIPQIVAALFGLLVGASMGAVDGQVVKYYFLWMGVAAAETVFFYSMAVCVLMFAGNMPAAVLFYGLLNFLYYYCCFILYGIISIVCFGMDRIDFAGPWEVLTPIYYLRKHVVVEDSVDDLTGGLVYSFVGGKALAGYLVAAAFFILIAFFVYQKKQLETAGDVITVGWLKPVFRWGAAVCFSAIGTLIFCSQYGQEPSLGRVLADAAIFALLAFFVAQMLLERSLRVFKKQRIVEAASMVCCVLALYLALDLDLFGIERKVPDQEDVKFVVLDSERGYFAQSPDEIAWVRDVHKQIVDSKKEIEAIKWSEDHADKEYIYLGLNYELSNGSTVVRSYSVPVEDGNVGKQIQDYIRQPEVILRSYFGVHYPDIEVYGATLDMNNGSHRVSQKDAQKLYKAVVKDVKEGHFSGSADDTVQYGPVETKVDKAAVSGSIMFDVHDEQGFMTAANYHYRMGYPDDDDTVEFYIEPGHTHLIQAIQKLGY